MKVHENLFISSSTLPKRWEGERNIWMKITQWNVSVSKLSNRGLGVIFLLITFETRQDSSWACVIDIVLVVIKRPHGPFFHIRFWTYCAPRGSRIRPRYINESAICNNVFFSSQILYAKRCSLAGYTNLFRIRTERRGKENIHINGHFTNQLEGTTMEWGKRPKKMEKHGAYMERKWDPQIHAGDGILRRLRRFGAFES